MANIKDFIKKIGNSAVSLEEQQQALAQVEQTIIEAKQKRTEAVGKNADMVIQALKTIEAKLEAKLNELNNTPAKQGIQGPAGKDGKDGKDGKAGCDGLNGKDGTDGKDGVDGKDGISVVDAKIDFDGSLVVYLSNGSEIDCGQILSPDVAQNIIINSGGSGTSQTVTDTLVSLQNQINTLTGIDGTLGSMAQQDANAVSITGGTINGTTIGATTPSSIVGTTITGQTGLLRGTGQNLVVRSQQFSFWCASGSSNVTGTDNVATAPDSTTTASSVTPTVTNGLHRTYTPTTSGTVFTVTGITYTFSFYGKANGYRYIFCNLNIGSAVFDVQAGLVTNGTATSSSITSVGNGWYRCVLTGNANSSGLPAFYLQINNSFAVGDQSFAGDGTSNILMWGAQQEIGSTANTYIPTTTTAVYGTPTLSFSGVSTIGLQSNGALFLQPAGTGAIQAQATTSTTAGGNVRGANAVDWQTSRDTAAKVASGQYAVIAGGNNNTASGINSFVGGGTGNAATTTYATVCSGLANTASNLVSLVAGGQSNNASGYLSFVGGGISNIAGNRDLSVVVGGQSNNALGYFNFIGGGFTNSGTSGSAVTTQSGTMNATTAVTLSGSNANIKVGQYITGTSIASDTYVAAISGTSLTLSKNASGSSTSTLSFFTPHGVVVGGGNNQATGSYSFIGGGGDGGTAANRNVASGDYSFVGGGRGNVASAIGAVCVGGGSAGDSTNRGNTASGAWSFIGGGLQSTASGVGSVIVGGNSNAANGNYSSAFGANASTRGIFGNFTMSSGALTALGDNQTSILVLKKQTTDATATVITSDGAAGSGANQVILPNNSAYYFKIEVIAGKTAAGDSKAWELKGAIKRGANAGTTTLIGTVTSTVIGEDAGASAWTAVATADTTNGGIKLTVTGQASTTIRWVARCTTVEMTF